MKKLLSGLVLLASMAAGCAMPPKDIEPVLKECRKIQYAQEPALCDYWQNPEETEKCKTGDCEDLASWLDRKFGERELDKKYNSRMVVGKAPLIFTPYILHAWFEIDVNKKTYVIDENHRDFLTPFELTGYKRKGILTREMLEDRWRKQGNLPNYLRTDRDDLEKFDIFVKWLMRR